MASPPSRLQPPVDTERDHVLGEPDAPVTVVEYGDYECPYCRRAHVGIQRLRSGPLEGRMRYVFRHFPNTRAHPHARLAAEAAEAAAAQGEFWAMHDAMFEHGGALDRTALLDLAARCGLDTDRFARELDEQIHAERVDADAASARLSQANATPTFFINGRRYDGPWDDESALEAMQEPLGLRVRRLAQEFAGLSASAGLLMVIGAAVALLWANSPFHASYTALWATDLTFSLGQRGFAMSLREWINDGLIVIFFFVVGLEIKRELTAGELADPRRASVPIAAAVGGMAAPALLFLAFNAGTPTASGWGVPAATDTAFALGLLAVLGPRVPLSLRIFVATLAIADDIGAILVLALFYTANLSWPALAVAGAALAVAAGLARSRVYQTLPYAAAGLALWAAILYSGVHPTLAGVLLALTVPTRSPPDTAALWGQSMSAFRGLEHPPHGERDESTYQGAVRTLETVVDRMRSPAQRLERNLQPWTSFLILPLFALANAGIPLGGLVLNPLHPLAIGIVFGLVLGKPLGIFAGAWIAVRCGLGDLPANVRWAQILGAGFLCGIGFTMAIFIASAAFPDSGVLALAKISIMAASVVAAIAGWLVLRRVCSPSDQRTPAADEAAESSTA